MIMIENNLINLKFRSTRWYILHWLEKKQWKLNTQMHNYKNAEQSFGFYN